MSENLHINSSDIDIKVFLKPYPSMSDKIS